jgi:N-acyl-D-aspartate/D-glutamate deacylase
MFHVVAFVLLSFAADSPIDADYVIRGATLYDGSGRPGQAGDLAIKNDRIVAVGKFEIGGKPKIIDATGLVLAPGFIDLHTHSDDPIIAPATRSNLNYLTQGVTTIVTGNCGFGPVDVAGYYQKIERGESRDQRRPPGAAQRATRTRHGQRQSEAE